MNYNEAIEYLFSQLPMYQRKGKAAYRANLDNTYKLDVHLNHPHRAFKTIHIGGTNGKGSSSHMLASILQENNYKVGLYTSPHLKDFRERIKINGNCISKEYVCGFIEEHQDLFEKWNLSFFEWTVGLCFTYFKQEQVDIAIIEVGLGGRLDSTNIIKPIACLITNIGLDHQQFLGNTLELIASEKAGIIKEQTPVVISETQPKVKDIFIKKAQEKSSTIVFADQLDYKTFESDLLGAYQINNQRGVLSLLPFIEDSGFSLNSLKVKAGIGQVVKNTGLLGRWQILGRDPTVLCDTAHNEEGLKYVLPQLLEINSGKLHLVLGFVNDKNVESVIKLFPKSAIYYLCQPKIPRALPITALQSIAEANALNHYSFNTVKEALDAAKSNATEHDTVFIGGSTFVVAEVV